MNNKISKKHNFGWYGNCGTSIDPCVNYDLESMQGRINDNGTVVNQNVRSSVESIIRVNDNDGTRGGMVFEKFCTYKNINIPEELNKTFDDYFNVTFKELRCGEAYLINTRGQFTDFEIGDAENHKIPSFYLSGVNEHAGISKCEDLVCYSEDTTDYTIISAESYIQDAENMVSSTTWGAMRGTIAYPRRNAGITNVAPTQINLYSPEENGERTLLGAITYAGVPLGETSNYLFFYVTSGLPNFVGQCLRGTIKFRNNDNTYNNMIDCNLDSWS